MMLQTLPTLPSAVSCLRKLSLSSASLKWTLQPFRQASWNSVDTSIIFLSWSFLISLLNSDPQSHLNESSDFSVLQLETNSFQKADRLFMKLTDVFDVRRLYSRLQTCCNEQCSRSYRVSNWLWRIKLILQLDEILWCTCKIQFKLPWFSVSHITDMLKDLTDTELVIWLYQCILLVFC